MQTVASGASQQHTCHSRSWQPQIVLRKSMTALRSLLVGLHRFFLVLFKAHLAIVVKGPKLVLSSWTAKIGRLPKEVDALCLIQQFTVIQCLVVQSLCLLVLGALAISHQFPKRTDIQLSA